MKYIDYYDYLNESNDVNGFNAITKRLERECGTNDLMFGHCETWASEVKKAYPSYTIVGTSLWSPRNRENRTPCHIFLYKDGLFYDADKPQGVKDPRSLPFFFGYKGPLDIHKVGIGKADDIHFSFDDKLNEGAAKVINVSIDDILPDKYNMEIAVDSLHKGMYSDSNAPLEVYRDNDKYILSDGHHRLLQYILNGDNDADVIVKDGKVSRKGTVDLDSSEGRYYGLDDSLENGWLINRL